MKKYWTLIAGALVLFAYCYQHAMSILMSPPGDLIFNDFSVLSYQVNAARAFFAESGTFWGYDPSYMAGYPLTFIWNSNVALQVMGVALRGVETGVVIRLFVFMSILLTPLFLYWTMRNFEFSRAGSVAGAIAATLFCRLSVPMLFTVTGMVTAGVITYLSVFVISLLFRYYVRPDLRCALLLLIFCPLALLIHKTIIVIVFVPVVILDVVNFRKIRVTAILWLAVVAAVSVAANWFWIGPMLKFMKYKTFLWDAPFWTNRDLLLPVKDYFTLGAKVGTVDYGLIGLAHTAALWLLLVGGIAGMAEWRRRRDARFALFAGTTVFLFFFCYYGSFSARLAELNPTRYLPVMNLLLAVPATDALLRLRRKAGEGLAVPGLFLAAALGGCLVTYTHLQKFDAPLRLRLGSAETADVDALIAKLKKSPPRGRILLEDSGVMDAEGGGQIYAYSQLPARFAELTGRQFIGGPYPYVFEKYHFAEFHDGQLFGQKIEDVPFEKMKGYAELYDITRVVCWSSRSGFYFDSYPEYFRPEWRRGPFRVYTVAREENPFISGSGKIGSTVNRIELRDIKAERGAVVIKYHWADTLRTVPRRKIERFSAGGDPIGFIRIVDPPKNIRVVNP